MKALLKLYIKLKKTLFDTQMRFVCVAASRDELHIRKMKLNYQEVGQDSKEVQALWERKLTAPGRMTVPQDKEEMYRALCQGEMSVSGRVKCLCRVFM